MKNFFALLLACIPPTFGIPPGNEPSFFPSKVSIDEETRAFIKNMEDLFDHSSEPTLLKNPSAQPLFFFPLKEEGSPCIDAKTLLGALKKMRDIKIFRPDSSIVGIAITCFKEDFSKEDKSFSPLWQSLIKETLNSKEIAHLEKFFKKDPERELLPSIFSQEKPEFYAEYKGDPEKRLRQLLGALKSFSPSGELLEEEVSDLALMSQIFIEYCLMSPAGKAFGLQGESLETIETIKAQLLRIQDSKLEEVDIELIEDVAQKGKTYIKALTEEGPENKESYRRSLAKIFLKVLARDYQSIPFSLQDIKHDHHELTYFYDNPTLRYHEAWGLHQPLTSFHQRTLNHIMPLLEGLLESPSFYACCKKVLAGDLP